MIALTNLKFIKMLCRHYNGSNCYTNWSSEWPSQHGWSEFPVIVFLLHHLKTTPSVDSSGFPSTLDILYRTRRRCPLGRGQWLVARDPTRLVPDEADRDGLRTVRNVPAAQILMKISDSPPQIAIFSDPETCGGFFWLQEVAAWMSGACLTILQQLPIKLWWWRTDQYYIHSKYNNIMHVTPSA